MQLREFVHTLRLNYIVEGVYEQWCGVYDPSEPVSGWNTDNVVVDLVREIDAVDVIELGSWQGASAVPIAKSMCKQHVLLTSTLLCVDTWLGSHEHIDTQFGDYASIRPHGAQLPLLLRFLSNTVAHGVSHIAFPFPATTSTAAEVLRRYDVVVDLVYVDAAHEYEDVIRDLRDYWPIVRDGGVLVGDDYAIEFPGVVRAVAEFAKNIGVVPELRGRKYIFRKRVGGDE